MIKRIAINSLNQNKQIAKLLKTKKFAAIVQTDTVMGLISLNPKLIYEIKQRPSNKKLIFFVNNINQVKGLNQHEKNVISQYWPGGLTVIKNGISYRMPDNKILLSLIKLTGPLYSSSANISGNNPITDTTQAIKEFNKSLNNLLIINGKTESNIPSTIIDLTTPEGQQVHPVADGTVSEVWHHYRCGGNMVWIVHNINGKKYTSAYYHLMSYNVSVGDSVSHNDVIGTTGGIARGNSYNTYDGCTTGPHLHLQLATGWYDPNSLFSGSYSSYSTFDSNSFNPVNVINF